MKINGLNGASTKIGGMTIMQSNDSVSKNIQNQIANAQKQLQELSANKEMGIEEKMKKRQEIQQQINELNQQLRQHQMEQRKEKQQTKGSSMEDMIGGSKKVVTKPGSQGTGLSQASMKAMISADSAMKQSQIQGSVAAKMEGRAGVLESEIKLDMARGQDVTKKKEELAEVEQKAITAETAQMNTLAEANKELEAANDTEQKTDKVNDKDKETDKKTVVSKEKEDGNITDTEEKFSKVINVESEVETESSDMDFTKVVEISASKTPVYSHVDVRL